MASFIDQAKIFLKAGNGGNGCLSFRREKYVPFGGPDGGSGGKGGDIYLVSQPDLTTLIDVTYRPHFKAGDGDNGQGSNKYGKSGGDLEIALPCGTVVSKNGKFFADLTVPYQHLLVCKGGRGGRGNAAFKTSRQNAPRIAERGQPGEEAALDLELKVLADVGLVGYPNAGKSTLLAHISHAHPKIADYPFTTLSPNLGVVTHKRRSFVVADIPGLIEHAHEGKGLGIEFLRHIERTRILIHIVDLFGYEDRKAFDTWKTILAELKAYKHHLEDKPYIICLNKTDLSGWEDKLKEFKKRLGASKKNATFKVIPISAATGKGINELLNVIVELFSKLPKQEPLPAENFTEYLFEPEFIVTKAGGVFHVSGKKVEDLVAMTDFTQPQAVARLQNILLKIGVEKELKKQGIQPGETVKVGTYEFDFS